MDKNGKVAERYPPTTSPLQIEVHASNIHVQKLKLCFYNCKIPYEKYIVTYDNYDLNF